MTRHIASLATCAGAACGRPLSARSKLSVSCIYLLVPPQQCTKHGLSWLVGNRRLHTDLMFLKSMQLQPLNVNKQLPIEGKAQTNINSWASYAFIS